MAQASNDSTEQASPLDRLQDMFAADMKQVNAKIVDNMQSNIALIPQIAGYLIAAGGKRIRPLLTLAAARMFDYDGDRPFGLAAAVEFIHTATLLHDDVVDGSEQRRGKMAANLVFGNQAAVLVGDFLFSRAFQLMVSDGELEVLRILSDASAIIAQGEIMQMATTKNPETTFADYEEVIKAKTAALFAAACEVGPIVAGQGIDEAKAMADYGMNLGLAFQVVDDMLDYSAEQAKLGKKTGDDFREGKMSAPVIFALENENAALEEREFWARTVIKGEIEDGDFERAQAYIKNGPALERCNHKARNYGQRACSALEKMPEGAVRDALLDLISFTINREF